jgi:hypothetical protein
VSLDRSGKPTGAAAMIETPEDEQRCRDAQTAATSA